MEQGDLKGLVWRQAAERDWSPEARLFAAFLVSGPHANRIGCFAFEIADAAGQTGLSQSQLEDIFAGFVAEGFIRVDRYCNWIWLPEILRLQPFADSNEVRRTLPVLAAVPRAALFHAELVHAFRASADRPGAPPATEPGWLGSLLGDRRADDLAGRLSSANDRVRRRVPGLPSMSADTLKPIAQSWIDLSDYTKRWREFVIDLVNIPALRFLALSGFFAAILFVVFPGIDLGVARWFFDPPRSFSLGDTVVGRFFDGFVHYAMEWFLPVIIGVYLYGLIRRRPAWGFTTKRFLFIVLSMALSAGLLTNVILKDSWGRARPSQVMEFGGPKQFSPPFMRSTQCAKNCSFVSGDASLAASFVSLALVADRNRRRWVAGVLTFTVVVGVMRMARGSHFLSDVVFGMIFTVAIVLVMQRVILEDGWRAWPRWRSRRGDLDGESTP